MQPWLHDRIGMLLYRTVYNTVDDLLLAYQIEDQDWQQCQQVRGKR